MTQPAVRCYEEKLNWKIFPWDQTPLTNLHAGGFLNTYPYNHVVEFGNEVQTAEFRALVVENEFVRATVVPELGCRVFSYHDKVSGQEVFQLPETIVPAPIHMRGSYIAVGLELNFPIGHSMHSLETVPAELFEDGEARGVRMYIFNAVARLWTLVEVFLRPAERILRTRLTFENLLPVRNGMMYWSNPSIEQTPELTFQCKAPMCHFFVGYAPYPIIDGRDARIAKNRRMASDLFGIGAPEEWFGWYSPEKRSGCAHVSPRDQMLGKKSFSWGFDDYAFRWGRHFRCPQETGYVEFQSGILETQMEFLHLEPFARRVAEENWVAFGDLEAISHADENFVFCCTDDGVTLTPARPFGGLHCEVECCGTSRTCEIDAIEPGQTAELPIPRPFNPQRCRLRVRDDSGRVLADQLVSTPPPSRAADIAARQANLDLEPTDAASQLEVAKRSYTARHFDRAETLARGLLETAEHRRDALRLLAEIAFLRDRREEARGYARQIDEYYAHSLTLPARGVLDVASPDVAHLVRLDGRAAIGEADALAGLGRYEAAGRMLEAWMDAHETDSATMRYALGYLAARCGDEAGAQRQFQAARELDVQEENPFTRLERDALEAAVSRDPRDAAAHALLGRMAWRFDREAAEHAWRRALECDDACLPALRGLGWATLLKSEAPQQALSLYERAVRLRPECIELIGEYVRALRACGRLDEALAHLQGLDEGLRADRRIIKYTAYLLRDLGRFEEALEALLAGGNLYVWEGETAMRRCWIECCMALGHAALDAEDLSAARGWFSRSLEYPEELCCGRANDVNESFGHWGLALVCEREGDAEQARTHLETAAAQPQPHIHHWVSHRENEFYQALAAEKIGDHRTFRRCVERLCEFYTDRLSAAPEPSEFNASPYAAHLAAARGMILLGEAEKARRALDNILVAMGPCWAYELGQAELERFCGGEEE